MSIRTLHGMIYAEHGDESRGCPVGHPEEADVRAWYRAKLAEVRGLADEDADDLAIAAGATPSGRVYEVATLAQAQAVRAVVRAGDVIVRTDRNGAETFIRVGGDLFAPAAQQ